MQQGEIYWLEFRGRGSEPRGCRPALVVQDDRFNRSAIATTVVAAITTSLRLADVPGNVRLRKGEGNLPRASVVNVTQLLTMDRSRLDKQVGVLSRSRVLDVLRGLTVLFGTDRLGSVD